MQLFSYARLAAVALIVLLALGCRTVFAADTPALVVVVSVDQLAYDYLVRFRRNFAHDGVFARCDRDGVWLANCHHRHAFTITAPGHAVQLTGCYPSEHGIVDNEWLDRQTGKKTYCVFDPTVRLIGTTIDDKPVSPRNLWADTLGDRLKIVDRRSKVFGIAIKDRASILMTGHLADAAYWMSNDGLWITSDYYRQDLPGYLRTINESDAIERYAGQTWDRLLPADAYLHGETEDSFGEKPYAGASADFPHVILNDIKHANFVKQVAGSPFGNEVLLQAAAAVLEHEALGQDDAPDMLCINLSSNDYVGHAFGPHSLEVEDMIYRTDRQLGGFVQLINERLTGQYWVLAITADHAVCPVPEIMQKRGLPAGRDPFGAAKDGNYEGLTSSLEAMLRKALKVPDTQKEPLVQFSTEKEVFLHVDHPALQSDRIPQAQRLVRDYLLQQPAVAAAATRYQLLYGHGNTKLDQMFRRTFHPKRSGDVLYAMRPYYIYGTAGTTHGSPWQYDTHVPLLLLAQGEPSSAAASLKPGKYQTNVSPAHLAPTLARLLNISPPAKCVEEAIEEVLK